MFISLSDEWGDTRVRIFDEDDDGCIHAGDLVDVLTTFGDKISKSEAKKLVQTADKGEGGLIDYEGMWVCELKLFSIYFEIIKIWATLCSHKRRKRKMLK